MDHFASKKESPGIVQNFVTRIDRHCGVPVCKIRMDKERSIINLIDQGKSMFQQWAEEEGIDIETPPANTKEPTGSAERPGGIHQERLRSMRGDLPDNLWPEIFQTAVRLHSILPSYRNSWKTPREVLDRWFNRHLRWYGRQRDDVDYEKDLRPEWKGIYAYGCKAFPLINAVKAHTDRKFFKVNPRAHIGYLVGYHSSNIYRIWVPRLKKVILSRDVTFNEHEFYSQGNEPKAIPIEEFRPVAELIEIEPQQQRTDNDTLTDFLLEFDNEVLESAVSNSGVGGIDEDFASEEQPRPDQIEEPGLTFRTPSPMPEGGLLTPTQTPAITRTESTRDASRRLNEPDHMTEGKDTNLHAWSVQ